MSKLNKKNVEIRKFASPMPFYMGCMVSLISTFIFPMYKITSWGISAVTGIISYFIIKKLNIFKDQEVEVEIPVVYSSTELEDLVNLGLSQIDTLILLNRTVDHPQAHEDINSIIETSELVIEHLKEHQKIEKDVRKYFRYYLDEIVKLVKHYDNFEDLEVDSENINISKEKIEATLANAKVAFKSFYNNLYAGKAMDISVDTKVFDSMLKQLQ